MKVLITGAGGLLGGQVARLAPKEWTVIAPSHNELDITNFGSCRDYFLREKPVLIINCAAIVSVDKCEENQAVCFGVNRDGVKNLLEAGLTAGEPLVFIQISSSEVFGRVNEWEFEINGYAELDESKPVSAYQRSKAEAEKLVEEYGSRYPEIFKKYFIARAGWLFGGARPTFVDQFFEALQNPEPLDLISDQWRTPTWTRYFCQALFKMFETNPSGIYHLSSEFGKGEATTPQVVSEIAKFLGEKAIAPITTRSRLGFFKVPRAPSNVLINTKLPHLPHWRNQIQEYLLLTSAKSAK